MENRRDKRNYLEDIITDTVSDLFYYDRRDDETMSRKDIKFMFEHQEVTVEEVGEWFKRELREGLINLEE